MATIPEILTLPEERPLQAPAYFHVMAKPTGAICNLGCEVRFACHGGCPRNRFIQTPDGEEGLNYLCAGYKAFFTHVDRPMRLMASLLRQGKYADEVMGILANEEEVAIQAVRKVGRNELCPCGSGKKHKHCHGSKGQMLSCNWMAAIVIIMALL